MIIQFWIGLIVLAFFIYYITIVFTVAFGSKRKREEIKLGKAMIPFYYWFH